MPAWLGRGIPPGVGRGPPPLTPNGLLPGLRTGERPPPPGAGRPGAGVPGVVGRPADGEPGRGGTGPGPGGRGRVVPSAGGCWARRSASRVRAAWAARTAASCSAFSAEARASAAATSMSWALAGLATGAGAGPGRPMGGLGRATGPRLGAAGAAGALVAPAAGAAGRRGGVGRAVVGVLAAVGAMFAAAAAGAGALPLDASRAPRSRRATGASTVLDADLTNSPISLSLARTVLLSTPSSFASSCTRALPGTALLTSRSCEQHPHRPHSCTRSLVISGTSSCAHVGRPTLLVRAGRMPHHRWLRAAWKPHGRARPADRCR